MNVPEFKRIVEMLSFTDQFKKIIKCNKKVKYNIDIIRALTRQNLSSGFLTKRV